MEVGGGPQFQVSPLFGGVVKRLEELGGEGGDVATLGGSPIFGGGGVPYLGFFPPFPPPIFGVHSKKLARLWRRERAASGGGAAELGGGEGKSAGEEPPQPPPK